MIEKRPLDIRSYNEVLVNDIDIAISKLQKVRTAILTFNDFGNANADTSLIILDMLGRVKDDFNDDVKTAAVSLRYLKNDTVSARSIADSLGVSSGTLLKWDEKSVTPEWLTSIDGKE